MDAPDRARVSPMIRNFQETLNTHEATLDSFHLELCIAADVQKVDSSDWYGRVVSTIKDTTQQATQKAKAMAYEYQFNSSRADIKKAYDKSQITFTDFSLLNQEAIRIGRKIKAINILAGREERNEREDGAIPYSKLSENKIQMAAFIESAERNSFFVEAFQHYWSYLKSVFVIPPSLFHPNLAINPALLPHALKLLRDLEEFKELTYEQKLPQIRDFSRYIFPAIVSKFFIEKGRSVSVGLVAGIEASKLMNSFKPSKEEMSAIENFVNRYIFLQYPRVQDNSYVHSFKAILLAWEGTTQGFAIADEEFAILKGPNKSE